VRSDLVRTLAERMPRPAVAAASRVVRRLPPRVAARVRRQVKAPLVSVVLPVYNVEPYLEECLDSVLGQRLRDLEVVLVDDGSTDGSPAIAAAYARRDPRVRVVRQVNAGLGAARNTGVRLARGRYLTFVDSDDRLPEGALSALVGSCRRTGSDLAVGAVMRFNSARTWAPDWVAELHATNRLRVTLQDFPEVLRNNYTWCKVFDRSFWDRCGLWFREGVAYEDQPIITQLMLRARAIDVLSATVYEYRARDDKSSISQQTSSLKDLRDRASAWLASHHVLLHEAPDFIYESWLQTLFSTHFHWYLDNPAVESEDYWAVISHVVQTLAEDAPERVWRRARPDRRVALELARRGLHAELLDFRREGGHSPESFPAVLHGDGLLLQLPGQGPDGPGLDDELFVLHREQLVVRSALRRVRWDLDESGSASARTLRIAGYAYIPHLDLRVHSSDISVGLWDEATGEVLSLPVERVDDPAIRPAGNAEYADYADSTFAAAVDIEQLVAQGRHTWSLQVTVRTAGFEVTSLVSDVGRSGSVALLETGLHPDGWHVSLAHAPKRPFRVSVEPTRVVASLARLDARRLSGRLRPVPGRPLTSVYLELPGSRARVLGSVRPLAEDGTQEFELAVPSFPALPEPAANGGPGPQQYRWAVRAAAASGAPGPVVFPVEPELADVQDVGDGVLGLERTRRGNLGVIGWRSLVLVSSASVTDHGSMFVEGTTFGTGDSLALRLQGTKLRTADVPVTRKDDRFTVEVPLLAERGRFGELPLPATKYWLTAAGSAAPTTAVVVDRALTRTMPTLVGTGCFEGRVTRTPWGRLELVVLTPRGEDTRGRAAQHALQEWSAALVPERYEGLLVRSYFGETATDNGLGVLAELRRRGSDLPVRWAVKDYSVPLPDGAEPVVHGSREWFRLLRTSRYYLDNMFQPKYHAKPDGQVMMQTFHGYPFKLMGHTYWEKAGFARQLVRSYDERAAQWDYLVSPAPYATPLLCREFRYDGPVLEIGYPRNDVLLAPDAEDIRRQVRESLGIADGQTAVLYAPTFRDELASDNHMATYQDLLGLEELARELGPDYVILLRGHAFHARADRRFGSRDNLLDVTDYPEISDLYLAADVAVVDYSSLRFDFGVTGKPMVFFVPDLDRYREMRGWLFDFAPTAPGPLLSTRDEVIRELIDLDGVGRRYAEPYRTFREEFLPLEDGRASARLVDQVFVPRGDAPEEHG